MFGALCWPAALHANKVISNRKNNPSLISQSRHLYAGEVTQKRFMVTEHGLKQSTTIQ